MSVSRLHDEPNQRLTSTSASMKKFDDELDLSNMRLPIKSQVYII
jgi:hypothetical protein